MRLRRFLRASDGLATIEYVIGAAVVLGTLVIGVSAWNNGLVSRLQAPVTQMQAVPLKGFAPPPLKGLAPPDPPPWRLTTRAPPRSRRPPPSARSFPSPSPSPRSGPP